MITAPEQCITTEDLERFERYLEAGSAKRRLIATLATLPLEAYKPTQWRGLVRVECGRGRKPKPTIPTGYKAAKLPDRNAVVVMPLWLYPFYQLHRNWQRYVFEPLIAIGIWRVAEGDYYTNGKWAWHI